MVDRQVKTSAFLPSPKTAETRTDQCREASINWEDDAGAQTHLFERVEQSKIGIAKLSVAGLKKVSEQRNAVGRFSWERHPMKHNLYHGNILFHSNSKPQEKEIAASLALWSEFVPRPEPSV
jgi:hypothetical protein